jgi:hypothetical protein
MPPPSTPEPLLIDIGEMLPKFLFGMFERLCEV